MIFELCDLIKEKITHINDEVLDKVAQITKVNTVEHALKTTETEKQIALYFLDWDIRNRVSSIDVINLDTLEILTTTTISDFTNGKYAYAKKWYNKFII